MHEWLPGNLAAVFASLSCCKFGPSFSFSLKITLLYRNICGSLNNPLNLLAVHQRYRHRKCFLPPLHLQILSGLWLFNMRFSPYPRTVTELQLILDVCADKPCLVFSTRFYVLWVNMSTLLQKSFDSYRYELKLSQHSMKTNSPFVFPEYILKLQEILKSHDTIWTERHVVDSLTQRWQ